MGGLGLGGLIEGGRGGIEGEGVFMWSLLGALDYV